MQRRRVDVVILGQTSAKMIQGLGNERAEKRKVVDSTVCAEREGLRLFLDRERGFTIETNHALVVVVIVLLGFQGIFA